MIRHTDTAKFRDGVDQKVSEADIFTNRSGSTERKKVSKKVADLLSGLSLALWQSFMEALTPSSPTTISPDIYSMFYLEHLHNLHFWVSVMLHSLFMTFLVSLGRISHPRWRKIDDRRLRTLLTPLFGPWNSLLAVIEKNHPGAGLHINFSKQAPFSPINGFLMKNDMAVMLEGMYYSSVDMCFPQSCGFYWPQHWSWQVCIPDRHALKVFRSMEMKQGSFRSFQMDR